MKTRLTSVAAGWCFAIIGTGYAQLVITNQPQTQATSPGPTATFTVGAHDTAPLAYQWQCNAGAGFSDLADRTNSVLTLTNAQPWDAWDYRVIVTNINGARTSTVAHLYVMSQGLLTDHEALDNFDDNLFTGRVEATGSVIESNQQATLALGLPGRPRPADPEVDGAAQVRHRLWRLRGGVE